jgi:hypothetical protein
MSNKNVHCTVCPAPATSVLPELIHRNSVLLKNGIVAWTHFFCYGKGLKKLFQLLIWCQWNLTVWNSCLVILIYLGSSVIGIYKYSCQHSSYFGFSAIYISSPFANSRFLFQVELYSQCLLTLIEVLIKPWHFKLSRPVFYINYDLSRQYVQGWTSFRCTMNYHAWLQSCPGSVESAATVAHFSHLCDCCLSLLMLMIWHHMA